MSSTQLNSQPPLHLRTVSVQSAESAMTAVSQREIVSPTTSIPLPPPLRDTIPLQHSQRTLVVCFDGTGNTFDTDNTNVVQLFSMLKKDDRTQQLVYYQPGVGTYLGKQKSTLKPPSTLRKLGEQMLALNLGEHVVEGYRFLMQHYINGDKISLFGFSRGAYTARALAGMLHKVGLLPPGNEEQLQFAYRMFVKTDKQSWRQANAFKNAFAIDVKIDFIGVWDTVRSVGVLDASMPFSASNNSIRVFRHAVALDEHRTKFQANHWNPPNEEDRALGSQYEDLDTDIKEVWFSGVHTDVGGGAVIDDVQYSLSKIALRWMVKECFRCDTGIMFDTQKLFDRTGLTELHLTPAALAPRFSDNPHDFDHEGQVAQLGDSRDHAIFHHERMDLASRTHDQLATALGWWVLEYMPLHRELPEYEIEDARFSWFQKLVAQHPINRGQGRKIPLYDTEGNKIPVFVHWTVHQRMQKKEYKPKAKNWKDVEGRVVWFVFLRRLVIGALMFNRTD